ncbi:HD-GYP domain-containing protein [Anaerolentibacter hominis]|uniref:HD-GYP domain-containing protein n=1 Tax=Anaerolentibacter hominis TaxID=3079009 RepID=UPI0031B8755A
MKVISSIDIIQIIRRTLGCVDPRLVGHGERVAVLIHSILSEEGKLDERELINLSLLGLLHDIGAYKTEDINDMMQFESQNFWRHSVYSYLYLKNFSPFFEYADILLFHHLPFHAYAAFQTRQACNPCDSITDRFAARLNESHYAGLIMLADRMDILLQYKDPEYCLSYVRKERGSLFSPYWADLFLRAAGQSDLLGSLRKRDAGSCLTDITRNAVFTYTEKQQFLSMIAYAIDFRSEFMVLHTITTVSVSQVIGELLNLEQSEIRKIYFGALLHDVGKVACPIEILEKPGPLTPAEMEIMKNHVVITEQILGGDVNSEINRIAVRHHEKLDGTGYPRQLTGADLTLAERIVAVADIVSALIRRRSYKDAFNREKTMSVLADMRDSGKLCPLVVNTVLQNYDQIIRTSETYGSDILSMYRQIKVDYMQMSARLQTVDIPAAR